MMSTLNDFIVPEKMVGERLDRALATQYDTLSRSRIKKLILEGHVNIDKAAVHDPACKLKIEQSVQMVVPEPIVAEPQPQDIPLDIVYEDKDVVVINKAPGMVVHPAAGNYDGTLVNALLFHCDHLSGIGGVIRPGIVHVVD